MSNLIEMLTNWVAYQLMDHTAASIFFVGILVFIFVFLVWAQFRRDMFDVRAFVCEYKNGQMIPATDKGILVGCWIISSYLVIQHYSDTALGAYLTIWVVNGGFAAIKKFQDLKILKGVKDDEHA